MATIKDVAKLAGVSHGTVSNTINGSKSVNSEIVKKVEKAIKELGYQPNLKARSLRNSKTGAIGVLLPNMVDSIYKKIYDGVEKRAIKNGYSINLYISKNSKTIEEKLLQQMQQQRVEGAIIVTCMPNDTHIFEQLLKLGIKLVFVRSKPKALENSIFYGIDELTTVDNIVSKLVERNCKKIALMTSNLDYSNERDCLNGYRQSLNRNGIAFDIELVKSNNDMDKENSFRSASLMMESMKSPDAIITTCPQFADGCLAAAKLFRREDSPLIITLDNESWVENIVGSDIIRSEQRYSNLGSNAMQRLLEIMDSDEKDLNSEEEYIIRPNLGLAFNNEYDSVKTVEFKSKKVLKVLLLESATAHASKLLKPIFTKDTGIEVKIDVARYERMYDYIITNGKDSDYDVIQINIPWINEAIKRDIIINLEEEFKKSCETRQVFSNEIVNRHGIYDGQLYALPYMLGTQILFYRKDLFSDLRLQRLYYEKHKKHLEVPKNWDDYDAVSKFFTKQYNCESPVEYGSTASGINGIYYFMLRLWESGINVFDNYNDFDIDGKKCVDIMKKFVDSFEFANPEAKQWSQSEQTIEFCKGNSAMTVIYQAHFSDYVYQYESKVAKENIGFAALPGKTSILGGWSLAVNANSDMKGEAIEYLKWNSASERIIPYNILGGSIPGNVAFDSIEMAEVYPWLKQVSLGLKNSRSMIDNSVEWLSQWDFELVSTDIITKIFNNEININQALIEFQMRINKLK